MILNHATFATTHRSLHRKPDAEFLGRAPVSEAVAVQHFEVWDWF